MDEKEMATLPEALVQEIDSRRGNMSRSSFIELCMGEYGGESKAEPEVREAKLVGREDFDNFKTEIQETVSRFAEFFVTCGFDNIGDEGNTRTHAGGQDQNRSQNQNQNRGRYRNPEPVQEYIPELVREPVQEYVQEPVRQPVVQEPRMQLFSGRMSGRRPIDPPRRARVRIGGGEESAAEFVVDAPFAPEIRQNQPVVKNDSRAADAEPRIVKKQAPSAKPKPVVRKMPEESTGSSNRATSAGMLLWIPAILLFGFGDVLTSVMVFSRGGYESNKLLLMLVGHVGGGIWAFLVLKVVVLSVLAYLSFTRMHKTGWLIPLVLSAAGAYLVVNNMQALSNLTR